MRRREPKESRRRTGARGPRRSRPAHQSTSVTDHSQQQFLIPSAFLLPIAITPGSIADHFDGEL
jgi:hypothetical protein